MSDEGGYECVAENDVGVAYSYVAHLYVRGRFTSLLDTNSFLYAPFLSLHEDLWISDYFYKCRSSMGNSAQPG